MGRLKPLSAQPCGRCGQRKERCPHRPQAHQQQQKRSIDVLPKPDNLTCCLQRSCADQTGRNLL
jgi:hypothetical protein